MTTAPLQKTLLIDASSDHGHGCAHDLEQPYPKIPRLKSLNNLAK